MYVYVYIYIYSITYVRVLNYSGIVIVRHVFLVNDITL